MRALRHVLAALACLAGCAGGEPVARQTPAAVSRVAKPGVQALRARESAWRARYSALDAPAWSEVSGADPYRIARWGGAELTGSGPHFAAILRGSKALVALDRELDEVARLNLRESPTALCVSSSHQVLVGSRFSPDITRVGLSPTGGATELGRFRVAGAMGVADLACGDGEPIYVLTSDPPAIVVLDGRGRELTRLPALSGGLRLRRYGRYLLESSLFERTLRALELDTRGLPTSELGRVRHDGPIWSFDAVARGSELIVAVAGVEDRPLVRVHGEFENIDSFAWLYRFSGGVKRLAELNLGERGLVVPKSIALSEQAGTWTLSALAAGSPALLRVKFGPDFRTLHAETETLPPGASDAVFLDQHEVVCANPLLDAWVSASARGVRVRPVDPLRRPEPTVRLGEALFFTELIAPENTSAGSHSRFSCETCHFEGGVDGRTHYTGRADVSVVTKPLFGLANNRPHFSRALDRDLSAVSHNEFRVAGAGSGSDPWFTLSTSRFSWLRQLGIDRAELSALDLREALLGFLYAFAHEPNPRVLGRSRFSELEARGARAFERHCEGCHAARSISDEPSSRVPLAEWEAHVFRRNAALVWARGDYERTGIVPYVHERGTRIASLRRLQLKPRYFTSGSAASLADVLKDFRFGPDVALHRDPGRPGLAAFDEPTRAALLAFLQLL